VGVELVLDGGGDGEGLVSVGAGELVSVDVTELVSVGDGDELVVAGAGDSHRPWPCGLQVWRASTRAPAEEVCATTAIGMVKPVSRAATTTARARMAFIRPRP